MVYIYIFEKRRNIASCGRQVEVIELTKFIRNTLFTAASCVVRVPPSPPQGVHVRSTLCRSTYLIQGSYLTTSNLSRFAFPFPPHHTRANIIYIWVRLSIYRLQLVHECQSIKKASSKMAAQVSVLKNYPNLMLNGISCFLPGRDPFYKWTSLKITHLAMNMKSKDFYQYFVESEIISQANIQCKMTLQSNAAKADGCRWHCTIIFLVRSTLTV